jgi:hypothetical protein
LRLIFEFFIFEGRRRGKVTVLIETITKLRNKLTGPVPEVPRTGPRMGYPGPLPTTRVSRPPLLFIFAMDTKIWNSGWKPCANALDSSMPITCLNKNTHRDPEAWFLKGFTTVLFPFFHSFSFRFVSFALGSSQILCPFFIFCALLSSSISSRLVSFHKHVQKNYCKDHAREKVRKNALPNLSKLARVCLAIIPAAAAHRIQLPLPTSQVLFIYVFFFFRGGANTYRPLVPQTLLFGLFFGSIYESSTLASLCLWGVSFG